jgi:hypothetical protein
MSGCTKGLRCRTAQPVVSGSRPASGPLELLLTADGCPWLRSPRPLPRRGGRPCTATAKPRRPFEPTSKRRRGFPLASPASSAATASSALTPSGWRSSGATISARADPAAAFSGTAVAARAGSTACLPAITSATRRPRTAPDHLTRPVRSRPPRPHRLNIRSCRIGCAPGSATGGWAFVHSINGHPPDGGLQASHAASC